MRLFQELYGVIWGNLVVIWGESMADSWSDSKMLILHLVFAWFLAPRFGVGYENDDFALVFACFLASSVRKPRKKTQEIAKKTFAGSSPRSR